MANGKVMTINGADFSSCSIGKIIPVGKSVTLTLIASPTNGGTVTGGGTYVENSNVQISATASADYAFTTWSDGNTNASRTINMGTSKSLTATFSSTLTNITDEFEWESGAWNVAAETNKIDATTSSVFVRAMVDISEYVGDKIRITIPIFATSTNSRPFFGDALLANDPSTDKTMLDKYQMQKSGNGASTGSYETIELDIPSTAKYICATWFSSTGSMSALSDKFSCNIVG